MSKPSNPRREADNEAKAVLRTVRVSPRKLDLVAATIRGKKAASAVNELTFSKKRIARDVKKALNSAIANAENNHNLDVDRLIVADASEEIDGKPLFVKLVDQGRIVYRESLETQARRADETWGKYKGFELSPQVSAWQEAFRAKRAAEIASAKELMA